MENLTTSELIEAWTNLIFVPARLRVAIQRQNDAIEHELDRRGIVRVGF